MIGKTVSHYRILEKLGEGGMGVVYKAHDTELDRIVALKFLPHGLTDDVSEQARFMQEAKAASALNHPNICAIHTLGEHEGERFIDMEFVDGKTLREIVPVKNLQDAITYAIQIAEALQEAHTHGIVHRDIKAENIMVNTKNQVKVMDFGLAKLKGSLKLTKTSSTIGTLAYMAPEQIQGEEVDARSDIFSFGIVLYEMLTGHLPFRGEHEAAIVYSIVNDEPEPLQHYVPDAPSELLHILDRALEKDREDRYQTVHDMLIDLRRLKKDSSRVSRVHANSTPLFASAQPVPPAEARKGLSKGLWVGIAGVVVLCAASVVYFLLRTPTPRLNPNRTTVTLGLPFKEIGYPSLSRDGNWIVFSAKDERGKWDVYWMSLATGKPTPVAIESAREIINCDISPDLSQIVYECAHESDTAITMKIVSSQGGVGRTLADVGGLPKWRPDGQRIGYMRTPKGGKPESFSGKLEIWSIKPDGTDNHLDFVDTVAGGPQRSNAFCWSPDGGSIAWVRNHRERYSELMVRELATGKEHQLTFDRKTVDEPLWTTDNNILFVSTRSGQSSLWVIPAGGGEPTQVTQTGVPIAGSRLSVDKQTLVYMQQENLSHIWVSSIDGSNARQVTSTDVKVNSASFSPDGKHIAYVLGDVDVFNRQAHLFVMDRDGKSSVQLSFGSESVWGHSWSPNSKWLAYTSHPIGEPGDSSRAYLIQPLNPGTPRLLCNGFPWWFDNESILVLYQLKNLLYSINGGTPTHVYQDSTFVFAMYGDNQLAFLDFRKGHEGWWVVPVDSLRRQKGEARRVIPADAMDVQIPRHQRFWIYRKADELWRVWPLTGKNERIGKSIPGTAVIHDWSMDGKEILWIKDDNRSKLVLVKNVFE